MATSRKYCHLTGEMLNLTAKAGDRDRINIKLNVCGVWSFSMLRIFLGRLGFGAGGLAWKGGNPCEAG
jgi:hypothetical protein